MKTIKIMHALALSLLISCLCINAELKKMNSLLIVEKNPAAKEILDEMKRLQETRMAELKEIQEQAARVQEEINNLTAKQIAMKPDEKFRAETQIKEKRRKLEELGAQYQRLTQDFESEMQMAQMRLQPFMMEAIQNAVEVAKGNVAIDALWDEATRQFVYIKDSADINAEVIKLGQKKNDQKTTLAQTKAVAPKAPTPKAA
jgi:DNA repair exonuclease SbcCD ATPase subunit